MAVHLLDFNRVEVYEAGASLITLLAYPAKSEEETREAVHASLCHHALRVKSEIDPDWGRLPGAHEEIFGVRSDMDSGDHGVSPRYVCDRSSDHSKRLPLKSQLRIRIRANGRA